jgi:site-specific DNA-adenine methylase
MPNNKNHFIISYVGNKRNEVDEIYHLIDNYDVQYIVEPFCGSCAFSYFLSVKYPKKYTYILNDDNENLINLLKLASNIDELTIFEKTINDILSDPNFNKERYLQLEGIIKYYIHNKEYSIRPGLFRKNYKYIYRSIVNCPIIKFLTTENIIFSNKDGIEIYKEYKNKNAIIFLDPPYLMADNSLYNNSSLNIYEYICNNKIKKETSHILL